ncbi:unnamed protein product [Discosporangium mesarthrocarpum]
MNDAWSPAISATALISVVPTLVLPFIPETVNLPGSWIQRILLSFSGGGMLGDVFLHLLPHLLMGEGHHHGEHSHAENGHSQDMNGFCNSEDLQLPLVVLMGFLIFFASERVVRGFAHPGHTRGHSHGKSAGGKDGDTHPSKKGGDETKASSKGGSDGTIREIKIGGILNLGADALHNLTDGIAIGAAFAVGEGLGYSTALATLLHELPHEVGDYTLLVQSGMSKWQAIMAQFVTAIAAFVGCALGLVATEFAAMEKVLLALTAGGFVYVACTAVMPEILSVHSTSWQALTELIAMCMGIALMAGVAVFERGH